MNRRTDSTTGARGTRTVGCGLTLKGLSVFAFKKTAFDTGAHMLPRKAHVKIERRRSHGAKIDAKLGSRILPTRKIKLLSPSVKARTALPGTDDKRRDIPATTRKNRLEKRSVRIVIVHTNSTVSNTGKQQLLATFDLFVRRLSTPLERSLRFGDKNGT